MTTKTMTAADMLAAMPAPRAAEIAVPELLPERPEGEIVQRVAAVEDLLAARVETSIQIAERLFLGRLRGADRKAWVVARAERLLDEAADRLVATAEREAVAVIRAGIPLLIERLLRLVRATAMR